MEREDMDIESSCTKTKLLTETLSEKILKAALKETEFEYKDESYQYSFFGWFRPSTFSCKKMNALSGSQITFHE